VPPDDRNAGLGRAYLDDIRARFASMRELAERALAQTDDRAFIRTLGDDENSIAVLVTHVGGNLRSRFTDFLTTDGEKPDRNRDGEFQLPQGEVRGAVVERWSIGWRALDETLRSLTPADLQKTVYLRGEPLTVLQALSRALAHVSQHVGQIVLLAKHWSGAAWETLSIPKNNP
jgi:hypothetical protein